MTEQHKKIIAKNSKSALKGTLEENAIDLILSLVATNDEKDKKIIRSCLKGFKNFAYDTILHQGDLELKGNVDPFDGNICNMIIDGNLVIDGCLSIKDDPMTLLLVTGDVIVRDFIPSGMAIINGNLTVHQSLIGDYNHGSTIVYGHTKATLFYPEHYFFTLHGETTFQYAFGSPHQLNNNQSQALFNIKKKDFEKLINILHPDVLQLCDEAFEDYKEETEYTDELWEFLHFADFKKYIKSGKPVLKP